MMGSSASLAALCGGLSTSLLLIFGAAFAYAKRSEAVTSIGGIQDDGWLFGHFREKVFDAAFPGKTPEEAALVLGIDIEKYYRSCALVRAKPDGTGLAADYVTGLFLLATCAFAGLFAGFAFPAAGILSFLFLAFYRQSRLNAKAEERRSQMAGELPRFLDLLQAELQVGMPIENAIYIICGKMPENILFREFFYALNEMRLGASGWQEALEKMADTYDIETLSEFVLNVTTAYTRGVSITETVVRKNADIRKTHLLTVKEKAGKMTNMVLFPVAAFQLLPMLVFLMAPVLGSLMSTSNGIAGI